MKLSVFGTLKETLLLASRYFWFLLLASVVAAAPTNLPTIRINQANTPTSREIGISVAVFVLIFVFGAMKAAGILGVLKQSNPQGKLWPTVATSIHCYSGQLLKLQFLLTLIALAITVPVEALLWLVPVGLEIAGVLTAAVAIIYLIFLKFALAFPLVVMADLEAEAALKRSWHLTRAHFFYVLGCYVTLAGLEYLLNQGIRHLPYDLYAGLLGWGLKIFSDMLDSLWIILGWRMYQRIMEAESHEPPPIDLLAPMNPQ